MKKIVWLIVFIVIAAAGLVWYFWPGSSNSRSLYRETYSYSDQQAGNPLMGYAPSAKDSKPSADISLLYVDIRWKDLEPQKGVYNWEELEKDNQFDKWRAEGKHLVLRFVLDYPEKVRHMDIPNWLYREMADPGDWYDSSYGRGFSPNYQDEKLRSYYQKAVQAMGQRWGGDGFISFIELGGLGHWGEWHVNLQAGIRQLPPEHIREQYLTPWLEAFPQAHFLMRRPFAAAKRYGLGLYNDMAGDQTSSQEWLDWIQQGGVYDQTGERSLVPMPESWQRAPIGGELTSSLSTEQLMTSDLDRLLEELRDSHTSFLGPKIAQPVNGDDRGYRRILQQMGYRLWISSAQVQTKGDQLQISTSWENAGVAPFYKDWKVYIYAEDDRGRLLAKAELPIELTKLLPGQQLEAAVSLPKPETSRPYRLSVGIVDPMTGQDAVALAVKGQEDQKRMTLLTLD